MRIISLLLVALLLFFPVGSHHTPKVFAEGSITGCSKCQAPNCNCSDFYSPGCDGDVECKEGESGCGGEGCQCLKYCTNAGKPCQGKVTCKESGCQGSGCTTSLCPEKICPSASEKNWTCGGTPADCICTGGNTCTSCAKHCPKAQGADDTKPCQGAVPCRSAGGAGCEGVDCNCGSVCKQGTKPCTGKSTRACQCNGAGCPHTGTCKDKENRCNAASEYKPCGALKNCVCGASNCTTCTKHCSKATEDSDKKPCGGKKDCKTDGCKGQGCKCRWDCPDVEKPCQGTAICGGNEGEGCKAEHNCNCKDYCKNGSKPCGMRGANDCNGVLGCGRGPLPNNYCECGTFCSNGGRPCTKRCLPKECACRGTNCDTTKPPCNDTSQSAKPCDGTTDCAGFFGCGYLWDINRGCGCGRYCKAIGRPCTQTCSSTCAEGPGCTNCHCCNLGVECGAGVDCGPIIAPGCDCCQHSPAQGDCPHPCG